MQDFRAQLRAASDYGASGKFAQMRSLCEQLLAATEDVERMLDIGALFVAHGFLSDARAVYHRAQQHQPDDHRITANLRGAKIGFSQDLFS